MKLIPEINLVKPLDFYHFPEVKTFLGVSPGLIYMNYTVDELAYSIQHYCIKLSKNKIMFCDYYEAPNAKYLILMNNIITKLCEKYNFQISDFLFLVGCLPTLDNKEKLEKDFKQLNLHNIKTVIYPFFEEEWSCNLNTTKLNLDRLHNKSLKEKIGLCFTGALRAHRVYILSKLIELNLIDKTIFSVLCSRQQIENSLNEYDPRYPNDMIHDNRDKMKSYILNYPIKYPRILTAEFRQHNRQHELDDGDIDLFANSYFSIIGETSFFKNIDLSSNINHWNFHLDYTFCTEKTFRAIACLHPFIMVSRPYTLKALREMGYRTFSPHIDESYDEIEDDDLRLAKIVEIIQKLYSKTDKEWIKFQQNTYSIVLHNYNHLYAIHNSSDKYLNARHIDTTRGQE